MPISILEGSPVRWGILVETPMQTIKAKTWGLKIIFGLVGLILGSVLSVLTIFLFRSFTAVESELGEKEQQLKDIAERVSHDIRSPLVALDMLTQSLSQLPQDRRTKIRVAVNRIQDIANDLVFDQHRKVSQGVDVSGRGASVVLMSSVLSDVISQKRIEFRPRIGLEIESDMGPQSYGLFAAIAPSALGRVVSNVINNAVDAVGEQGTVRISLSGDDATSTVSVTDNGPGVDPALLERLGKERVKSRTGGKGLGLFNAQRVLVEHRGRLQVNSQPGHGTTVRVTIPRAPAPQWFIPEIRLVPGMVVVVVDDDQSIHQIWAERIGQIGADQHSIEVRHFSSPAEFLEYCRREKNASSTLLYLMDYEYETRDGLSVIEELGIATESVLVTSHFENPEVLRRAEQLRIRVLPKSMAPYIPVKIHELDPASDIAPAVV